jgi:hypothetical protein
MYSIKQTDFGKECGYNWNTYICLLKGRILIVFFLLIRKLLLNEVYRENSGNEYFMLAVGHLSLSE